jgi:hypothetical protein
MQQSFRVGVKAFGSPTDPSTWLQKRSDASGNLGERVAGYYDKDFPGAVQRLIQQGQWPYGRWKLDTWQEDLVFPVCLQTLYFIG